jgi:hypothetical protein
MPSVENRELLVKLAKNIYEEYLHNKETIQNLNKEQVEKEYLGLNVKQADKYNRLQFFFDPKRGYAEYYLLFNRVFESGAKAAYQQLKAQHPLGIEIWVNPTNKSYHPIIERQAQLVADSLLSSAKMMLNDLNSQQEERIKKDFKQQGEIELERLKTKYSRFSQSISELHETLIKDINKLYDQPNPNYFKSGFRRFLEFVNTIFSKEKALSPVKFHTVQDAVLRFQSKLVVQLSGFEKIDALPDKKDFKRNYKELSKYEQRLKFRNFYGNKPDHDDKEGDIFNRDIFALDITENKGVDGINVVEENWHYHQRHYILTCQQILLQCLKDGEDISSVNYAQPQATATSHSPDYLLPNWALIEEGTCKDGEVKINFSHSRHGSPTPDSLYPQQIMPRGNRKEAHEATYYAFLNMEQHLLQLRIKVIENILTKNNKNILPEDIAHLSRIIGLKVTDLLHEKLLSQSEISPAEIIQSVKQNLPEGENLRLNDSLDALKALTDNADAIVNVKNIHTHLITGTGVGSLAQAQRYMFSDARLAQYATWDNAKTNAIGYIYMCNGVNRWRDEDIFMDSKQKLRGNNCVAFIEFFKKISSLENSPFSDIKLNFDEYHKKLSLVQEAAKQYMRRLEHNYITLKIEYDKTTKMIEIKKRQLKRLKTMPGKDNIVGIMEKEKIEKIIELTTNLSGLKEKLETESEYLKTLRKEFKDKEAGLHQIAMSLNSNLHNNFVKISSWSPKVRGIDEQENRSLYLASRAFLFIENFFNQDKWKLDENNGLMQALIHLAAEQMGMFASGGCKSNNDRALLLALIISELSKIVHSNKTLGEHLKNVLPRAQEAYAWHIARTQTELDRSSIPKTGSDILKYAKKILKDHDSQYEAHQKFGEFAAHKRQGGYKKIKKFNFDSMNIFSVLKSDAHFYNYKIKFEQASDNLKGITEALTSFIIEKGLSTEKKINALENVKIAIGTWQKQTFIIRNLDYNYDKAVRQLSWDLEIRHYELRAQQETGTTLYNNLKTFFDNLQARLGNNDQLGRGQGLEKIRAVIEIYSKSNEKELRDLLKLYLDLRTIAFNRRNDRTNTLAESSVLAKCGFSFFKEKRPEWLRKLYRGLQQDINGVDFRFDEVLATATQRSDQSQINNQQPSI